jgi:hypothetical protein
MTDVAITDRTVKTRQRPGSQRRGLAPLELVLGLPLLLMVMALAIYVGNAASWKLRAANVARDTVWNTRWPRSGATPQPMNWPAAGMQSAAAAGNVQVLYNGSIDQPVARGPMLGQTQVNRDLLDPTRGLVQGNSSIQRPAPLMSSLGNFSYNLNDQIIDNGWQYQQMGMASNVQRREPIIYNLAQPDPSLAQAYQQAATAILTAPFQPQLAPLDKDPDILAFYGSYHDFHPQLGGFCSLDTKTIQQQYVQPLILRIQGNKNPPVPSVAKVMAQFFLNMYRTEQQLLQAGGGLDPQQQAQLAQLGTYIAQLNAFIGQIQ